jgi:hypothetical protein
MPDQSLALTKYCDRRIPPLHTSCIQHADDDDDDDDDDEEEEEEEEEEKLKLF